ncbi:NACHT domain-containing protein [Streptomyces axinellae]|uniref:NACHT domain-containing protein n=1 Tax=Streptomyces axinellae TaxID=552788 RepID=A0ABN3QKR9_9ACTN
MGRGGGGQLDGGGGGGGARGSPRWENRITGGTFGTVVMAERVDAVHIHVHEEAVAPPRPPFRLFLLAGLLACLGAVLWAVPPALLSGSALGARLPGPALLGAASLAGSAGAGRVLERRRAARRRTPLPAHRLDRAAEGLAAALARQYGKEDQLALSPVSTPTPIPVRWRAADPLVADHEPNVLGLPADGSRSADGSHPASTRRPADGSPPADGGHPAGAAPPADRGAASGALDVEGEFAGTAAFFASLPRQRLVLLGAPGAGKTVLAYRLARTLLEARGPASAAPVPVVLPLASWHPGGDQGLWQWAAERLCAEHPVPLPTPGAALDLIESGRVLPVLDGFDELPRAAQADALRQLRASLTEHARCVLTSRSAEYTRAVEGAALPLPGAVAIELCPLTTDDLWRYLPRTSRRTSRSDPTHTKWSPVLERLADPGDSAREVRVLRQVLSTPLMVALARVVYSESDADPAELLGGGRFTTVQAVERHLYDAFLTAAYADAGRERAARARRWASLLAAHTRRFGGQEIAWWRLEEALPLWLRRLSVLPAAAVATLTVRAGEYGTPWWDGRVPVPLWAGFGVALLAYAWGEYGSSPAWAPRQLRRPCAADLAQVHRAKAAAKLAGWALLASGVAYMTTSAASGAGAGAGADTAGRRVAGLLLVAAFFARSLLRWVLARARQPADPETAAEPAALLRRDRRVTLALGVSPTYQDDGLSLVWALPVVLLAVWDLSAGRDVVTAGTWLWTIAGTLLSGWLYEVAGSAWGRYTLARSWFAATGRLPWQLMDFLREAHSKHVLRQAGGVYRFRHIELRNRLAADIPEPARGQETWRTLAAMMLRGLATAAGGLLLAGITLGMLETGPAPAPHAPPASACAALGRDVLGALMSDPRRTAREEPRLDPERTVDDRTCAASEQAPLRPEVQVSVRVRTFAGDLASSGPARASHTFETLLRFQREQRTRARSLDHALHRPRRTLETSAFPGDRAMRAVSTTSLPGFGRPELRRATYLVRDGNRLVTVDYGEEFASRARVAAVAESLLRRALGRTDAQDLAGVPRTRLPDNSRLAGYRRPERRLHGAVWGAGERSFVWKMPGLGMGVRAPKDLDCGIRAPGPGIPESVDAYGCENVAARDLGRLRQYDATLRRGPRVRLHAAQLVCGRTCSREETRAFLKDRPGPARLPWRKGDGADRGDGAKGAKESDGITAYYAVRRTAGTYELSLWGPFRTLSGAESQLWVSVRVDPGNAALAQKIVNSAYTQIGGG